MKKIKLLAKIGYETPKMISKNQFASFIEKNNSVKKDDDNKLISIIIDNEKKEEKLKNVSSIGNLSKNSASQMLLNNGTRFENDYLSYLNVEIYVNEKINTKFEKIDDKGVIDEIFVNNVDANGMFNYLSFETMKFEVETINQIDTFRELMKQLIDSNTVFTMFGEMTDDINIDVEKVNGIKKKIVGTKKLSKEELLNKHSKVLNKNIELLHEVERQFKIDNKDHIHMIGYYLENKNFVDTHLDVLTEALYSTGRITENAYYSLDIEMTSLVNYSDLQLYEKLIELSAGCFFIINFKGKVWGNGDPYVNNSININIYKSCDRLVDKLKSMQYSTTYGFTTSEEVRAENCLNVETLEKELKLVYFKGKFSEKQAIDYATSYLAEKNISEIKGPIISYINAEYQKGKILSLSEIDSYILEILRTRAHRKYNDIYGEHISKKVIYKEKTNLNNIIGLENFKQEVTKIINMRKMLLANEDLTLAQVDDLISNIGFRFEGETGVGKSMAAKLLTKILYQENIIKKDFTKICTISESESEESFDNFGQPQPDEEEPMFNLAQYNEPNSAVLLIENIHGVSPKAINNFLNDYDKHKKEAVVIICGTKKEFDELDEKVPGFKSRFSKTVKFNEYTVDELLAILSEKLKEKNYKIDDDTLEETRQYFVKAKQIKNFGNARFVENFAEHIIELSISRMLNTEVNHNENMFEITKEDILKIDMVALLGNEYKKMEICDNAIFELNNLIGLSTVKEYIKSYVAKSRIDKMKRKFDLLVDEGLNMHLCFTGNPGTAKTTVARQFARILYANGIVDKPSVVECGLSELQGMFLGQTAPKIIEKFEEAKGGVLFIDEAYALNNDDIYSKQSIDTIVAQMENHREDVIVIFAGYKYPMENFIKSNPGLKGRVSRFLDFPNYSIDELLQIFDKMLQDKKCVLDNEAAIKKIVREKLEDMIEKQDFSNAREVRLLIENANIKQSMRLYNKSEEELDKEQLMTLTVEDFTDNVKDFYKEKNQLGFAA